MGADHEKADSVYEFLYVDLERVSLLLSQFGSDGVLKELTRETVAGSGSHRGVDLKLVQLGSNEDETKGLTRTYDPRWLLPLIFLDKVQDRLRASIMGAKLGELLLAKGSLAVISTAVLQTLYSKEALQTIAIKKAMQRAEEAGAEFDFDNAQFELDAIIHSDPHVQMHFRTESGQRIWSTLRADGLVTPASELALKHGATLDGIWHVVGIKDADPIRDLAALEAQEQRLQRDFADVPFVGESVIVSSALRRMFGRPVGAYGVTPVLIFRQIGG